LHHSWRSMLLALLSAACSGPSRPPADSAEHGAPVPPAAQQGAPGPQGHSGPAYSDSASKRNSSDGLWVGLDSAALLRQLSAESGGGTFHIGDVTVHEFADVPFRVATVRFKGSVGSRIQAFAVDKNGARRFFDSGIFGSECGDPDAEISNVSLMYLSEHPLVVMEERRHYPGCCGASMTEVRTSHLFDASRGFRRVLRHEKSMVDYNNDECGGAGVPVYRNTYFYPNVCDEHGCSSISFFTLSSDKNFRQRAFAWGWNRDSSALIEQK